MTNITISRPASIAAKVHNFTDGVHPFSALCLTIVGRLGDETDITITGSSDHLDWLNNIADAFNAAEAGPTQQIAAE